MSVEITGRYLGQGSFFVCLLPQHVTRTIQLDRQLAFHTGEIHDEDSDEVLPPKLEPCQRSVAQGLLE